MMNNENATSVTIAASLGSLCVCVWWCDPHFTGDKNERQPFVGTEVSVGLGSSEQKLELLESLQCLNISE